MLLFLAFEDLAKARRVRAIATIPTEELLVRPSRAVAALPRLAKPIRTGHPGGGVVLATLAVARRATGPVPRTPSAAVATGGLR